MAMNVMSFLGTSHPFEAKQFYKQILNFKLVEENDIALTFDMNGSILRISIVQKFEPLPFTVLGWIVKDIESKVGELQDLGVLFERYPNIDQNESNIAIFPDGARVVWFKDPDSNLLSLTQLPFR